MANRPLHIVHTESSCGWGGQEIRILTESAGMIARGHRVTLLCPAQARIFREAEKWGVPAVALPIEKKRLAAIFAMGSWLRRHRPDVVNTHSSTDTWLVTLSELLPGPTLPVVRTRHISAPVKPGLLSRWLYGKAVRRVVTTGEALRADLLARLGLPQRQVISIPTGIDLQRYSRAHARPKAEVRAELGIPPSAKVVGIAATLRSWKGHDYLLEAFGKLLQQEPDAELLIVGDGPRREYLEEKIAAFPAPHRIHLVGHRNDVPDMLAAMDVFALPSYANEGVPQAIMQAMALELPVVSTRVGAIDELVADGITGFLVQAKEAPPLTEALVRLLRDEALRRRLGEAGRQVVEARYSLEGMVAAMEQVFRESLERPATAEGKR